MSIKKYIATHDSTPIKFLKFILYKFKNKFYKVNELIEQSDITDDYVRVKLKNGLVMYGAPSPQKAELPFSDRVKYGVKTKLNKIIDVDRYYFIYEIISEAFCENVHFKYFQPKEGDTVVDCGANIGAFVLQVSRMVGKSGKIIAFEPDELNASILEKNVKANNIENVLIIRKGVWSKKDVLTFHIGLRPGEHSFVIHEDLSYQNNLKKVDVEVDTLDNMLSELGISKIDFIKMDIEGAEIEAIKGMKNLLTQHGVKWVIEAAHVVNNQTTDKTVLPILIENGLSIIDAGETYRGTIYAINN